LHTNAYHLKLAQNKMLVAGERDILMKNLSKKENCKTAKNKIAIRKQNKVVRVLLFPAVLLAWIVGWALYWLG
jgi:hypothetical protein